MCWGALLGPALVVLLFGLGSSRGASPLDRSWGSWEAEDQPHVIVRKTVFITPTVRNCPDGFEWNAEVDKCLRVFKYNRVEQYHFMLERLKALYAPQEIKKTNKELGPVYMNVPIGASSSLENETANKPISEETVYTD